MLADGPSINQWLRRESGFGLALALAAVGDLGAAKRLVDDMLSTFHGVSSAYFLAPIRSFQARLALARGDRAAAGRWMSMVDERALPSTVLDIESPRLTRARVLLEQGTPASLRHADEVLEQLQTDTGHRHDQNLLLRTLTVRTLLRARQGREAETSQSIMDVLTLAAASGRSAFFLELGEPFRELLERVPGDHAVGPYATLLEDYFATTHSVQQAELTRRELEVLRLLAKQLSDKEIGQSLGISPMTVKVHASSLYNKMRVLDRRQAVRRAGR